MLLCIFCLLFLFALVFILVKSWTWVESVDVGRCHRHDVIERCVAIQSYNEQRGNWLSDLVRLSPWRHVTSSLSQAAAAAVNVMFTAGACCWTVTWPNKLASNERFSNSANVSSLGRKWAWYCWCGHLRIICCPRPMISEVINSNRNSNSQWQYIIYSKK